MSAIDVALLTPCFWPEVRRGGERYVRDLADGLIARGHHPRLITSHPGLPRRTVEDGLPIARVWRPVGQRWLDSRRFEHYLTHAPLSYACLRRANPDIAHAHFTTDALAATRWGKKTGRPTILTYHGIPDRPGLDWRRLRLAITRRVVRDSTAVTAVSQAAADAFRSQLGVRARVIHPGVDLGAFGPVADKAQEPTIFCAADPDEPRKRVGLLVRAFALLRRERPAARLRLISPRNPALASELRRAPGVELVAPVSDPRALAVEYSHAWASALPSFGDSFGIALIESLACGTPVVASDRDALPEVVDRAEIGNLFHGDEPEALAQALLEALDLAQAPATAGACRSRAQDFSIERCVSAHEALYRELL